jgi:MerR family mercuric resistance operon transcriptional regulator
MDEPGFTIAKAAEAAAVGVETIRYYERRGLVAQPAPAREGYRRYDRTHVARIRFIKRAQDLGFSLHDIQGLLALEDGTHRSEVQRIACARLAEIRSRLEDLRRMERALTGLLDRCRHGGGAKCPIIEAIAVGDESSSERASDKRVAASAAAAHRVPKAGRQAAKPVAATLGRG